MQIRTQYYLSGVISTLAIAVVATTLFYFSGSVAVALKRSNFGGEITAEGISGLRLVTIEYILYQRERAKVQWLQRHESLGLRLASDLYAGTEEQIIVNALRQRHQYVKETFFRLVKAHQDRVGDEPMSHLAQEVRARLVSQIMLATQDMVADATSLSRIGHEQLTRALQQTTVLVLLMVVLIGVVVALNVYLAQRHVVRPIRQLTRGAEILGKGELSYRTSLKMKNEFGDLSSAFDAMAAALAEARAAMEHKTAQLQESNAELESFSYSVAHDLRSPLRAIDGWSLALEEDLTGQMDKQTRSHIDLIRAEAQRMGRLIDDLLVLAHISRMQIKPERLDLSALAQTVAGRLKQRQEDRCIEFDIQTGLAAWGDAKLIEIALTNLFDNAVKFTAACAPARIQFGSSAQSFEEAPSAQAVYFVRDNGAGFDMAYADKLFGAFQRLHKTSEFPGNGIGLATVRRIVQQHQGCVWAEAQVGKGATFYFTLGETA